MTGYGKALATVGTKKIAVEIRTLNSKQLDLNVKMPAAYRPREYEVRSLAAETIGRGKADIYVTLEEGASGGATINRALFETYFRQIKEAAKATGIHIEEGEELIPAILRLPDVLTSEVAEELSDEEGNALAEACRGALTALDKFRTEEGAILLADMLARVSTISGLLERVEPFEKARIGVVRARILENIASMGVAVDSNRLEQEMIFWVEKFDITEEKVRLAKHCDYFRTTAGEEEGAGRKLGFIAQEMGREINTLGSKANDAEIQKLVVQMKDELEKIKEQLLNIL